MRTLQRILALALLAAAPAAAGSSAGTAGADFLRTEQSARGIGMGGAYSAVADDVGALWWNPAGIARLGYSEAEFNHTALIEGISSEYLAFAKPLPSLRGALGASVTYLSVPGLDGFDASKNSTGKINASAYAGTLAYGVAASSEVTVGAAAKFLGQKLATEKGTGFALDLGAQYHQGPWGAGFSVQNLGPAFRIGSTSDPLPRTIRGGGFYSPLRQVTVAFEEEKPLDADARFHLGGEWHPTQTLALRAGYQQTPNVGTGAGFTVGFGVVGVFGGQAAGWAGEFTPFWERMSQDDVNTVLTHGGYAVGIDYAFVSNGELTDVHRISLSVRF